MMNLGSEGVYLDEKCRTNPSRYLPGPFGVSGVRGRVSGVRVYKLGCGAALKGPYSCYEMMGIDVRGL